MPAACKGFCPVELSQQGVARILDDRALGRRIDVELRRGNADMAVTGFHFLPGVMVLREDNDLDRKREQGSKNTRVEMNPVILIARQHGVIKNNEARTLMLGPCKEQRQPQAMKLRLAENRDYVAKFRRGAVGVR
jgi:hypothetical protein